MTKTVRIENADSGTSFKLVVQTWDKGQNGAPDVLAAERRLDHPTALAETYVTSTRYLVVKEVEPVQAQTPAPEAVFNTEDPDHPKEDQTAATAG